jgi:hypothetical protein
MIWFEAVHEDTVIEWFLNYKNVLKTLNIRSRRNVVNFDESDFRTECMKRQELLVSIEIRKHYAVSSENRKSVTMIEMIHAAEEYPPRSW